MMQMTSVRLHDGLIFRHSAQHSTDGIEYGQTHTQHTYDHCQQGIALEHAQDTGYRQNKAKECGACITHEDFRRVEVSGKETQTRTCQSRCQNNSCCGTCHDAQNHQTHRRNGSNTCRQTIQTIDQVHSVCHANDPDQCNGDGERLQICCHRPQHHLNTGAGHNNDQCRQHLHAEFQFCRQVFHIVDHTQTSDHQCADNKAYKLLQIHALIKMIYHQNCDNKTQYDGHPAHTGHWFFMHASVLWIVNGTAFNGKPFRKGRCHQSDGKGAREGCNIKQPVMFYQN